MMKKSMLYVGIIKFYVATDFYKLQIFDELKVLISRHRSRNQITRKKKTFEENQMKWNFKKKKVEFRKKVKQISFSLLLSINISKKYFCLKFQISTVL